MNPFEDEQIRFNEDPPSEVVGSRNVQKIQSGEILAFPERRKPIRRAEATAARRDRAEPAEPAATVDPREFGADFEVEGAVPDELECAMCMGVYNQPVRLDCHHVFCAGCITASYGRQPQCPVCRASIRSRPPFAGADDVADELERRMRYHCSHTAQGCGYQGTHAEVLAHVATRCPYALMLCPKKCGHSVPRSVLSAHVQTCAGSKKAGTCDCGQPMVRPDGSHHDWVRCQAVWLRVCSIPMDPEVRKLLVASGAELAQLAKLQKNAAMQPPQQPQPLSPRSQLQASGGGVRALETSTAIVYSASKPTRKPMPPLPTGTTAQSVTALGTVVGADGQPHTLYRRTVVQHNERPQQTRRLTESMSASQLTNASSGSLLQLAAEEECVEARVPVGDMTRSCGCRDSRYFERDSLCHDCGGNVMHRQAYVHVCPNLSLCLHCATLRGIQKVRAVNHADRCRCGGSGVYIKGMDCQCDRCKTSLKPNAPRVHLCPNSDLCQRCALLSYPLSKDAIPMNGAGDPWPSR